MPIIGPQKTKLLKEIASYVCKGSFSFDIKDCPVVMSGGQKALISSVSYSPEDERLVFDLSDTSGRLIPSGGKVRSLELLDVSTLSKTADVVRRSSSLRMQREHNIVNIGSRLKAVVKGIGPSF